MFFLGIRGHFSSESRSLVFVNNLVTKNVDSFRRVKLCFWRLGETISIEQCSLVREMLNMLNRSGFY